MRAGLRCSRQPPRTLCCNASARSASHASAATPWTSTNCRAYRRSTCARCRDQSGSSYLPGARFIVALGSIPNIASRSGATFAQMSLRTFASLCATSALASISPPNCFSGHTTAPSDHFSPTLLPTRPSSCMGPLFAKPRPRVDVPLLRSACGSSTPSCLHAIRGSLLNPGRQTLSHRVARTARQEHSARTRLTS